MAITITQQAFADMLTHYLADEASFTLHLFSNNHTPTDTDTVGSYTEATFTGYSYSNVTWGSVTVANPATVTGTAIVFTSSADQTPEVIYGAYLQESGTTGHLCGAVLFTSPITIQYNGDSITVTPTLTMAQC